MDQDLSLFKVHGTLIRSMGSTQIKVSPGICFGKNFMQQAQRDKKSFKVKKVTKGYLRIKVILTVRESDERWWKSWHGFMKQEIERFGFGDFNLGAIFNEGMDSNRSPGEIQ